MLKMKFGFGGKVLTAVLVLGSACLVQAQMTGFGGMGGVGSMGGFGDSGSGAGMGGPDSMGIRPWLSANGTYAETLSTGTLGVTQTQLRSMGYGGSAGLSGGKRWQRDTVVLFGTAAYQRYVRSGYSSGLSGVGALSYQHEFSPRLRFQLMETFGSTYGGYGYGAGGASLGGAGTTGLGAFRDAAASGELTLMDPANNGLVDGDIINSRATFNSSSAGLVFQPSLRWSFGMQGGTSQTRRSGVLSGLNSYGGGGFAGYRFSQRTMMRLMYGYSRFEYPKLFGGNEAQYAAISLQQQFTPRLVGYVQVGGNQIHINSFGAVAVDPAIASLLGTGSVLTVTDRRINGMGGGAGLNYSRGRTGMNVAYDRGLTPGNGVLLASKRESVMAGASFTANTRTSLGISANYNKMSDLLRTTAKTDFYSVQGNLGFRLVDQVHLSVFGGYRAPTVSGATLPAQAFAGVGLSWSPEGSLFRF